MALREDVPAPLDPDAIIVGARRRRTRRRVQLATALVSAGVVLGSVPLAMTALQGPSTTASAPGSDAQARSTSASPAAPQASRAGAPPAPQADRAATTLPDGLRVEPRGVGFCVLGGRTGQATCRDTEGLVVATGDTRRWVVFHGAHRSDSVQYAGAGGWLRMEPRIAFHGAPTMVAYAADPAGDGPFRVRQLTPDKRVIWEG